MEINKFDTNSLWNFTVVPTNLQAIRVNIIDINSSIVEPIVGHLNTFRDDITHHVETLRLIPPTHESKLFEIFHGFEFVGTSLDRMKMGSTEYSTGNALRFSPSQRRNLSIASRWKQKPEEDQKLELKTVRFVHVHHSRDESESKLTRRDFKRDWIQNLFSIFSSISLFMTRVSSIHSIHSRL